MNYALDACAMIALLRGEPGATDLRELLINASNTFYAHGINLIEVHYDFVRRSNTNRADQALADLLSVGIVFRRDMGREFCSTVSSIKARGRISLADCFCIALAREIGGSVVTTDHREFDSLVPLGVVPIHFIR